MKITDEQLSGFLDAELSAQDMELVRTALETDDELVMRMAELSQVDQWVVKHAQQIDQTPVPQSLLALARKIDNAQQPSERADNNVVQLSARRKANQTFTKPLSIAAGIALVVMVGVLTTTQQRQAGIGADIAAVLNTSVSGETRNTPSGVAVKAQLSFANQAGQLCRQYQVSTGNDRATNIACKGVSGWQLEASSNDQSVGEQGGYQTASKHSELDNIIDTMISGAPLDKEQELRAIDQNWQVKIQ
ncbi:hypothetical protein [Aliiglaciecola litoralis]|uniref:Anti-sigma factor n=1 Tax=Aliiglaciecola litoralis TaxID=582857 RepID=A0ABN1LSR3_9ALTE